MTDIPMAPSTDRLPENLDYWVTEASALKAIAEQGWDAERKVSERLNQFYGTAQMSDLRQSMETMRRELNFLFECLISLSIQHLAIGILIIREPTRFVSEPPGHRIVGLVEACGILMTDRQIRLLRHAENTLGWKNYFPALINNRVAKDVVQGLERIITDMGGFTGDDKRSLDKLYVELEAVARQLQERAHEE